MRSRLALCLLILPLAACKPDPDFDTRYNAQAETLNATARSIEDELNSQLNASAAADPGANASNDASTP